MDRRTRRELRRTLRGYRNTAVYVLVLAAALIGYLASVRGCVQQEEPDPAQRGGPVTVEQR